MPLDSIGRILVLCFYSGATSHNFCSSHCSRSGRWKKVQLSSLLPSTPLLFSSITDTDSLAKWRVQFSQLDQEAR
jgi:hypothetical protein